MSGSARIQSGSPGVGDMSLVVGFHGQDWFLVETWPGGVADSEYAAKFVAGLIVSIRIRFVAQLL